MSAKNYKNEFTKILGNLETISKNNGDVFRARAYKKAQEQVMIYNGELTSMVDLENISCIGKTIKAKFQELLTTGMVKQAQIDKSRPENIFVNVYGIGSKKAKSLANMGIKTIEELRERQDELLNDPQKKGLKYYEDILKRIPRIEINTYKKVLDFLFKKVNADSKAHYEIVGSYRRGAKDSGDIDIIITHTENDRSVFAAFLDLLIRKKILIEVLSRGDTKSLGVSKLKGQPARRIDFMFSTKEEYPFAIMYFTGSKTFNTLMRQRALDLGYSMNEHCFCHMVNGKKGARLNKVFADEKEIFDFLGMVYKTPKERDTATTIHLVGSGKRRTLKKKKKVVSPSASKKTVTKKLEQFREVGYDYLLTKTENTLSHMIRLANAAYYNQKPILTDNEYDILKEFILNKFPENIAVQEVGAPIEKKKTKLPFYMASMNKIKPDTNAVVNWKQTYHGPYVISGKLDGVSGLYTGKQLFTRGNGEYGQDISYFINGLNLPQFDETFVVRGEFIIKQDVFDKQFAGEFSNSRNFVSGVINSKKIEILKLRAIDFVCYEVVYPQMTPSQQMKWLINKGFNTVKYELVNDIDNDMLSEKLQEWRNNYEYTTDGLVIYDDQFHDRKNENPKHAFAFKMVLTEQEAEAKVLNVSWNVSVHGYLKPRVRIEPVNIAGVMIKHATGHNAAFIKNNKIGFGAVVKVIRSGDVIPKITEVIQPAAEASMPNVPYKWTSTKVDVIMDDFMETAEYKAKQIKQFFDAIGVEGLGPGNIKRIMNGGFDTIEKMLVMSVEDLMTVDGFKEKSSTKLVSSIKSSVDKLTMPQLMYASNIFGRGLGMKRMKEIMKALPDILVSDISNQEKLEKVSNLPGYAEKTARLFVNHIDDFVAFIKKVNLQERLVENMGEVDTSHPLYGKRVVFTGFKNQTLEERLDALGANVMKSVSKKTDYVLVMDMEESTTKAEKARKLGVKMVLVGDFIAEFSI